MIQCNEKSFIEVMVKVIKKFVPVIFFKWYRHLRTIKNRGKTPKQIFSKIKEDNIWGSTESVSGTGSDLSQTEVLIIELPKIFKEKQVRTVLDIPCGDFNWMKKINLSGINYIGADIVDEIIKENVKKYSTDNVKFVVVDVIKDILPESDIILVRDCFVHLSYKSIFDAIENIKKSCSLYLLTTTFTAREENYDIVTGDWRPLNLQIKPFMFPIPDFIINENCTEGNGKYKDKSLGLWDIKKL